MKLFRIALISVATVAMSAFAARPASAASPWQLCLTLDTPTNADGSAHPYLLNLVTQGNAVLVVGTYGHDGGNNSGPVFGGLARSIGTPGPVVFQMGLTITIGNGGDFMGSNTENIVFNFTSTGIGYKHWYNGGKTFTQGNAYLMPCPSS